MAESSRCMPSSALGSGKRTQRGYAVVQVDYTCVISCSVNSATCPSVAAA
jgi:hypothetical protein